MEETNLFTTFPDNGLYLLPIGSSLLDINKGVLKDADGVITPIAKHASELKPLKHLWIFVNNVINVDIRYKGETQYVGRVPADGFYFEDLTYDEVTIVTTVATNIQMVGSTSLIAGIGGVGGTGVTGGTGDIETVETDIDGKEAVTTNSLIYGRESAGVTHPVKVDLNGNILAVITPGATLEPAVVTTASCAAGAAIQFNIPFANLATLKRIQIEQLLIGTYNYTIEVWKSATYTPGTMTDHHLKIFSRDVNIREWGENIDGGLLYRDDDAGAELHCRIANKTTGTTSTFNVSVIGVES